MTVPTIHLNGTPGEHLFDALVAALDAVREANRLLAQTAPNGRDYYPQGPSAIVTAQNEHVARAERLWQTVRELEALALAVQEQNDQRKQDYRY